MPRKTAKTIEGNKRNFFATMSATVIKSIKQAALEDDITASEALEEAAKDWLEKRRKARGYGASKT